MNAKERVYRAVNGAVPDRVPVVPKIWVDLGAKLTETRLLEVISEPMQALRAIAEAGRLCRVDGVRLFHFPLRKLRVDGDHVYEVDSAGELLGEIDMQGGLQTRLRSRETYDFESPWFTAHHHFWTVEVPIIRDQADAARICVPDKSYYEEIGWGERQAVVEAELGEEIAVLGNCSSATMAFLVSMRGMSQAMMDLIEEPELAHRIMEKGVAIALEKARFNLDRGVEVLRLNDSVGNMSVISPEHWREFVFPHMKVFCDEVHAYSPRARIYCHICGNVLPIVEDLVETGMDCIGPLDPLGGFTPADVRKRIGEAVSLMGGVDTLSFVEHTPEQLKEESRRCIIQAGARGGFVLGSGCVVPRSARAKNLRALREAADQFGGYEGGKLLEPRQV